MTPRGHKTRNLLAMALWMTAAPWASGQTSAAPAAQTPSYAVISELAREVSVVGAQNAVGSRIDQSQRQRLPIPDGALDKVALLAAQTALKKASAQAGVWLIAPADTDFFQPAQSFAVGETVVLPPDLSAALKENRSTHLLLMTRFRSDAEFRFSNMTESRSALEGLGLFVERVSKVTNRETGVTGIGFLAPYVFLRVTLIDTATSKVVNSRTTKASRLYSAGEAKDGSGNPWEALTGAEKINTLRDILMREVDRLVPLVLAAP
jgi:hypothetical protein